MKVAETAKATNTQSIDDFFDDISTDSNLEEPKVDAPNVQDEEDTYDLQKELEAKFDELFGPLDD